MRVWEASRGGLLPPYISLEIPLPLSVMWLSHILISSPLRSEDYQLYKFPTLLSWIPHFFPPGKHGGRMNRQFGWGQVRKLVPSITLSLHQWKRGLRSRRKDGRHTRVRKANILRVLGALPLCPIISGMLLQLQLSWAGTIPMSFSTIHGVCPTASLSGKKTPPIDQGRWQESWVSTVRLKTTHVHLVRFKHISWDNITMNCRPRTISKEWFSLMAFPQHFLKILLFNSYFKILHLSCFCIQY